MIHWITERLYTFLNISIEVFKSVTVFDILDIVILTLILYKLIKFFRQTKARFVVRGIIAVILVYGISTLFKMQCLNWILSRLINYSLLILIIIFNPEIRKLLESFGNSRFKSFDNLSATNEKTVNNIDSICKALEKMSERKVGALIIMEKHTPLSQLVNSGITVNADVSERLIRNLFYHNAPLHDGAIVIKDNKILAASCYIQNIIADGELDPRFGTRHRAALGMSQQCDAVILVVSEETGEVSYVHNGKFEANMQVEDIKELLMNEFITKEKEASFWEKVKKFIINFF